MHGAHRASMHTGKWHAAHGSLHSAVSDRSRHRRTEIQRVRLWIRPVRRNGQGRERENDQVLQLVLLLHKHRLSGSGDSSGVHTRQPGTKMGLRNLCLCYSSGTGGVLVGNKALPLQETWGKPSDADCDGVCGGLEEQEPGDAFRLVVSVRHGWHLGGPQEDEAKATPHRSTPVLCLINISLCLPFSVMRKLELYAIYINIWVNYFWLLWNFIPLIAYFSIIFRKFHLSTTKLKFIGAPPLVLSNTTIESQKLFANLILSDSFLISV